MNEQRNFGAIGQQVGCGGSDKNAIAGEIRGNYATGLGIAAQSLGDTCGGRQTAKGVIRERVFRLREEADRLETLLRALPEELPPKADQALWDMAIAARRG